MRVLGLIVSVVVLGGCSLPDDEFVVDGQVLATKVGGSAVGVQVQVLRSLSSTDCANWATVATTQTDSNGNYRFELVRQQLGSGVLRIEASDDPLYASHTLIFPDADLHLPGLVLGRPDTPNQAEFWVDGALAWRAALAGELDDQGRYGEVREAAVAVQDLSYSRLAGQVEMTQLFSRVETRSRSAPLSTEPPSAGASCSVAGVPCPLTDRRFEPVPVTAGRLEFGLSTILSPTRVRVANVGLSAPPARVRLETSADGRQWEPYASTVVNPADFDPGLRCDAAGVFVEYSFFGGGVPRSWLRLRFVDPDDTVVPFTSVAEVTFR